MVRSNKSICGFKILDERILLSKFADDITLFFFFVDGKRESLHACIRKLQNVASLSGLSMNFEKTMVEWTGSREHPQ